MRKFLVSYGVRQEYGVFKEVTEELKLDYCKDSLSNGNLAKFILDYLQSKFTYAYPIVLYNFWEIQE